MVICEDYKKEKSQSLSKVYQTQLGAQSVCVCVFWHAVSKETCSYCWKYHNHTQVRNIRKWYFILTQKGCACYP